MAYSTATLERQSGGRALTRPSGPRYVERRYAPLVLEWVDVRQPVSHKLFGYDGAGARAAGPLALAQDVVVELLTDRGSMPFKRYRGCDFMRELRSGQIRTAAQLSEKFVQAAYLIRDSLESRYSANTPDDERLAYLRFNSGAYVGAAARLDFSVVTQAGPYVPVLLPLTA